MADYPISKETAHHLAAKFGTAAWKVLELTRENPHLSEPILAGTPPIQAEVVYSVRDEFAVKLEDVVARRLGIQFWSWREAIQSAPVVAARMAEELHWSDEQTKAAVAAYIEKINGLFQRVGLEPEAIRGSAAGRVSAD